MKKIILIQGVFFQDRNALFIDNDLAAKIKNVMTFTVFHAIIGPNDNGKLSGQMHDKVGDSMITEFTLSDTAMTFTKNYLGRPPIYYRFTKGDFNQWIGGYHGNDCGSGQSKCILTETNESFLYI